MSLILKLHFLTNTYIMKQFFLNPFTAQWVLVIVLALMLIRITYLIWVNGGETKKIVQPYIIPMAAAFLMALVTMSISFWSLLVLIVIALISLLPSAKEEAEFMMALYRGVMIGLAFGFYFHHTII